MNQLGIKIVLARKNKGFSQEKLAEDAKINLRTLQRIEKGDSYPHGDTLTRLTQALDIPFEDLIDSGFEENYGYIKAMHFVSLVFIILPLGNILLPLIFWLTKNNKIKDLAYYAKKLINFQITLSLVTYLPFAPTMFRAYLNVTLPIPNIIDKNYGIILALMPLILKIFNALYLIVVGLLIKNECKNYFPIAIRFIK